ncbi:MAG: hypothetical protein CSA95_02105 [Bacteroidetes bacterium]|nr:MAG: hypothetical protein CSA95_02105 [Bacteroidota bacterium]PIE87735.1 MAG: hypothetical protein CSA04_05515 [Bacteroidota bacterium]
MDKIYRDSPCHNLQQVVIEAAEKHPSLTMGFVKSGGEIVEESFRELLFHAGRVLHTYEKRGLKRGDYLVIATDDNQHTIHHFWGAILGGIIPTILQPPVSFNRDNPAAEKLLRVYELLGKPHVVLSEEARRNAPEQIARTHIIIDYEIETECCKKYCDSSPTDTAYLQFSSGSTGHPKGVMLSHQNLLSNVDAISEALRLTHRTVSLNWMPLYHDMGLVGYHITPVYIPLHQLHLSTDNFIKDPFLWLRTLSSKRVQITGCPNFGQALINRHLLRKSPGDLDLSSLRAILNGAEPISAQIMEEFMQNLAPYGLRPEAMMPVYGMAEATLAVSFNPMDEKPVITSFLQEELVKREVAIEAKGSHAISQRIVNVGYPLKGVQLSIRDGKGVPLPEGRIGEVWIKGDHIFKGYFRDRNHPLQEKQEWLHSGDQGFIINNALHITGRYKDIIFINGKNFYAHDLEYKAIQACALTYGKFIIGGYHAPEEGHDHIIAFMAGSDNPKTRAKRHEIAEFFKNKLGITIHHFVFVRSNQIHKTSSGKIRRFQMIQDFLSGKHKEAML